jgi:hypothetical protein
MCTRRTAAGMLEAETRFRTLEGYHGLAQLAVQSKPTSSNAATNSTRVDPAVDG